MADNTVMPADDDAYTPGDTLAQLQAWQEAVSQLTTVEGLTAHQTAELVKEAETASQPIPTPEPSAKPAYNPYIVPGDPTPDQYAALSASQMAELERVNPGVGDRMSKSLDWEQKSAETRRYELTEQITREHNAKLESDEDYLNSVMRSHALKKLREGIGSLDQKHIDRLRSDSGVSDEEYAEIERGFQETVARRMGVES